MGEKNGESSLTLDLVFVGNLLIERFFKIAFAGNPVVFCGQIKRISPGKVLIGLHCGHFFVFVPEKRENPLAPEEKQRSVIYLHRNSTTVSADKNGQITLSGESAVQQNNFVLTILPKGTKLQFEKIPEPEPESEKDK